MSTPQARKAARLRLVAAAQAIWDTEAEALINTYIHDVDLDDQSMYDTGELGDQLSILGESMAREYVQSGLLFWLRRVDACGQAFLAIGTSSGSHSRSGHELNVYCTTPGHRTIKDADSELVVHHHGRQLTAACSQGARKCFVRFVPLLTRRQWNIWASTMRESVRRNIEGLRVTIVLSPNAAKGYDVLRAG